MVKLQLIHIYYLFGLFHRHGLLLLILQILVVHVDNAVVIRSEAGLIVRLLWISSTLCLNRHINTLPSLSKCHYLQLQSLNFSFLLMNFHSHILKMVLQLFYLLVKRIVLSLVLYERKIVLNRWLSRLITILCTQKLIQVGVSTHHGAARIVSRLSQLE